MSIKASNTITLYLHIRNRTKYGCPNWAHLCTLTDRLFSLSPKVLLIKSQEYYIPSVQKFLVVQENITNKCKA